MPEHSIMKAHQDNHGVKAMEVLLQLAQEQGVINLDEELGLPIWMT